jgi:hypothetical protein
MRLLLQVWHLASSLAQYAPSYLHIGHQWLLDANEEQLTLSANQ